MPIVTSAEFLKREFDYLIAGGGTAGLAVAASLSEDPNITVGVLEAGPAVSDNVAVNIPGCYGESLGTNLDWQFQTTSQPGLDGRVLKWPRGKVLGGTSALNFMTWNRGNREDYGAWEELGNPGWGWDDLMPFFKKTEHFHPTQTRPQDEYQEHYDQEALGTDGPVQISHARQYSASHKLWHATLNALEVETNKQHLSGSNVGVWTNINAEPNALRPNLLLLCETIVEEIELRQEGDEWIACGVRIKNGDAQSSVSALREVILSAGSVQSPQLLELSGVGNPDILSRAGIQTKLKSSCVGENLQDHFMTAMIFEVDPSLENPDDLKASADARVAALELYAKSQTGPLTVLPCSICYIPFQHFVPLETLLAAKAKIGNMEIYSSEERNIRNQRFDPQTRLGQIECIFDLGNLNPIFKPEPLSGRKYGTILQILQNPFSRGSIHIKPATPGSQGCGILEAPVIDPQYFVGEHGELDLELMVHCARFANKICSTQPLASIIRTRASPPASTAPSAKEEEADQIEDDETWRQWLRENTISDWHPVGTCAMGGRRGIETGVVDERLRVYGVQRLRVVDASVIPLQISAHLQATVYAIAEKGSSMILEDRLPRQHVPYRRQKLLLRGPREGLDISRALYSKAETQNGELSDDERARFLARGDIVGRALAHPDSLSLAERYKVFGWPLPEQLHQAIHDATGGEASTPRQLLDKVRQESCSVDSLTLEALELLVAQFMEVREIFNVTDANNDFPGKEEARRLLGAREGVGEAAKEIFGKAMDRCSTDPAIRSARQAKFEATEARGERGLLVQLPEPFGVVSLEDSFQRLEEFMPEAVQPSSWPGGDIKTQPTNSWVSVPGREGRQP
ncbi:uncharacterized protein PG986_002600 [Apiospora aurea]|uniref:Glucose-methanol-choline oxidoreductase N-terminal domain-containing protein n=1 Tax=Apiospora aurea TaxID=335848 RepID=A0ABR1QP98_9PEZI